MTLVRIPDASGKTMILYQLEDNRLFPPFDPEVFKNIPSFKFREDDVVICAYPKSGTHWVFEICRLLQRGMSEEVIEPINKMGYMIEFTSQDEVDKEPSPRILDTHIKFDDLPSSFAKKQPKLIFIRRNPKDVVVSYYNHVIKSYEPFEYTGEFKDYFTLFIEGKVAYGSWFEYNLHWEKIIAENKNLSILSLTYEDMKEDLAREIRKISDFLGIKRDEELIRMVTNHCSFSSMALRNSGISSIIYRKGNVGDWKNWVTVAQNESFDKTYEEKMAGSKLEFQYSS